MIQGILSIIVGFVLLLASAVVWQAATWAAHRTKQPTYSKSAKQSTGK